MSLLSYFNDILSSYQWFVHDDKLFVFSAVWGLIMAWVIAVYANYISSELYRDINACELAWFAIILGPFVWFFIIPLLLCMFFILQCVWLLWRILEFIDSDICGKLISKFLKKFLWLLLWPICALCDCFEYSCIAIGRFMEKCPFK